MDMVGEKKIPVEAKILSLKHDLPNIAEIFNFFVNVGNDANISSSIRYFNNY